MSLRGFRTGMALSFTRRRRLRRMCSRGRWRPASVGATASKQLGRLSHSFDNFYYYVTRYFKASKFTSFTRKLNRWGFTRVPRGPETGAYFHKLFRRDKPELCLQMTSNSGNKYVMSSQQILPMPMGNNPYFMNPMMANMTPQQQQMFWQSQMQMMQMQHMQMMQMQPQQQQQMVQKRGDEKEEAKEGDKEVADDEGDDKSGAV